MKAQQTTEGYTSGPWRVGFTGVHADDGTPLARDVGPYTRGGGAPHDERAANARLMAAAPDLYEAARSALATWDASRTTCVADMEGLRAAVARAAGDSNSPDQRLDESAGTAFEDY